MAMHGINMPLSITGMEVVWYNLLKRLGYTTEEVNEFISGPAFMAWWQMNNLEGWGGPNPDSWYQQQEALQKKIVARMRELGIEPVFPGYAGMVPRNIGEKLGYQIADPGKWCGFPVRLSFLRKMNTSILLPLCIMRNWRNSMEKPTITAWIHFMREVTRKE